ncbi:MAG: site-2 protease family protein, partial [Myxococcales bacterium]|nr:site-2 protease family protein [Myxococcales bacterium]
MFRIFGIPVTVRPMFLFVTLFLGASSSTDPINIGIWFVVVFISILIHELGHALTGRAMGLEPQILLHGFGGLAIFSNPRDVDVSIPRSVAITLAGPFAGFAFGALVYLAVYAGLARLDTPYLVTAISYLLWVNIGWGLVNLLPIMPLDGGQVVAAVLRRVPRGQLISYVVSAA